jgi:hypothetical protein
VLVALKEILRRGTAMGLLSDICMCAKEVHDKRGMDKMIQWFKNHKGDELYWQQLLDIISQIQHWGLKKDECIMAGAEKGFEMASDNEQRFMECIDRIEAEVGIDKGELERRINKALGREDVFDIEELGYELAVAMMEMTDKSLDEICSTLNVPSQNVLLEYVALLLWIVTKQTSILLSKNLIQSTIDYAHNITFSFLEDAGFKKVKLPEGNFNETTFEKWIRNRFELYYWAWNTYYSMKDECSEEEVEALSQASEAAVAMNFVVCCFGNKEEYHKLFPCPDDRVPHTVCVLNHFRQFTEKARSILLKFAE